MSAMQIAENIMKTGLTVKGVARGRVTIGKIVEVFRSRGACPQTKVLIEDSLGNRVAYFLANVRILPS